MDTYVKQIVAAIAAALDAAGKPAGLAISTSRARPSRNAKYIAVFPLQDEAPNESASRNRAFLGTRRLLTIGVVCRCAGTDLDNEILRAWAVAQLFKDETFGGIAVSLAEGETSWLGEIDSKSDYSDALMQFIVEYSRPRNSLEYAG
jgi:hypothetical protein